MDSGAAETDEPGTPASSAGAYGGAYESLRSAELVASPLVRHGGVVLRPPAFLLVTLAVLAVVGVPSSATAAGWVPGPSQLVPPTTTVIDDLRVAHAPDGRAVVVWRQLDAVPSVQRVVVRLVGVDGELGPVRFVSPDASAVSNDSPRVAVGPDGTAIVVWKRDLVEGVRIAPDGTIGPVRALSVPARNATLPRVAIGPDGAAYVAWSSVPVPMLPGGDHRRAEVVRLDPGAWPAGAPAPPQWAVSSDGELVDDVDVVVTPDGNATVAWRYRYDATPLFRIEARRVGPGGPVGAVAALSANGDNSHGPTLLAGADNRTTVAWRHTVAGVSRSIRAARVDAAGVAGPAVEVEPSLSQQLIAGLAPGAGGATAVVTSGGVPGRVVVRRLDAAGALHPAAGADPTVVSTPGAATADAVVASTPGGSATVAWRHTSGDVGAYGARIAPDGAVGPVTLLSEPGAITGDQVVAAAPDGSATVAWIGTSGADLTVDGAHFDATAPRVAIAAPATATVGVPVSLTVTAGDRSTPLVRAWSLGDGTTAGDVGEVTHTFATAGTRTVSVTVTDARGNARVATRAITVRDPAVIVPPVTGPTTPVTGGDPPPTTKPGTATGRPALRALRVSPRTARRSGRASRTTRRLRVRFVTDRAGVARVTFRRRTVGRRSGTRCVASTRKLVRRGARRCVRWTSRGTVVRRVAAGRSTVTVTRLRVGRRTLPAGRYRVAVRVTDARGIRSAERIAGLRVRARR